MSVQKIINLLTILLFSYCLYYLNSNVAKIHQSKQNYIDIVRTIGNGQTLSDEMKAAIVGIAKQKITDQNQATPICLIKAYYQLTVEKSIKSESLFTLFSDPHVEYNQITNCSHYYSLLLYRAQHLKQEIKNDVVKVLEDLQRKWMEQKYQGKNKQTKLCVYFNSYNIEASVKNQVYSLSNQNYNNYSGVIEDDGSTDNSPIFIKYSLEQMNKKKVIFTQNKQKQGVLKGFIDFINRCEDDSIVVILTHDETLLGSNALWIIDRVFSNDDLDLAFFSSLTIQHSNLENIKHIHQINQSNPFIAFRKNVAMDLNIETSNFTGLDRALLTYHLINSSSTRATAIKVINECIVSRSQQKIQSLSQNYKNDRKLTQKMK